MASVKKLGGDLKQATFNPGEKVDIVRKGLGIGGVAGDAFAVAIVAQAEYAEVVLDSAAAGFNGVVGVYNAIRETKNKLAVLKSHAALSVRPVLFNKDVKAVWEAVDQQKEIKKLEKELKVLVADGDDIVQKSYEDIQKIRESNGK
jgi:hypothetical protein